MHFRAFVKPALGDGIIMLLAGTWAHAHPDQVEAIIPIALAIVGSIGAFLPDNHKPKTEEAKTEEKPEEKEDDTRSGARSETSDSDDSGRDAGRERSGPESHPKTDARVEPKEETKVRQGNDWRVEPRGNDFDIVPGGFNDK